MRYNDLDSNCMEVGEESMDDGRDLCDPIDADAGENEITGSDYGNNDAFRQKEGRGLESQRIS